MEGRIEIDEKGNPGRHGELKDIGTELHIKSWMELERIPE